MVWIYVTFHSRTAYVSYLYFLILFIIAYRRVSIAAYLSTHPQYFQISHTWPLLLQDNPSPDLYCGEDKKTETSADMTNNTTIFFLSHYDVSMHNPWFSFSGN